MMSQRSRIIGILFFFLISEAGARVSGDVSVLFVSRENSVLPGKIVNLSFFIQNNQSVAVPIELEIARPEGWQLVTRSDVSFLHPEEKRLVVASLQVPSGSSVGNHPLEIIVSNAETKMVLVRQETTIRVKEVVKISLQTIESPEHLFAGETYRGRFLLKNPGNTGKRVFLETVNCKVEGNAERKLEPGEATTVTVVREISSEMSRTGQEFLTLRALVAGEVMTTVVRPVLIFPVKQAEKDLFFRFPVEASTAYMAAKRDGNFSSGYQFELSGKGTLDPEGKHRLEFLARGPNNAGLGFLGMYDQYFISYGSKNLHVFLGEKSYQTTPLTESSRFGAGIEHQILLNNGLGFGFLYVKPRFFREISNEMAVFSQYEKDRYNKIALFFVRKKHTGQEDLTWLGSINTAFRPFEKTTLELEASRGYRGDVADNAFRGDLNSRFYIFRLTGNYFFTGKNYPGYYSNSIFYSGSFSARIGPKLDAGFFAREDFSNARLDTFFVSAPYSRSLQTYVNWNPAPRAYLKLFVRESERKDRLALDKFHYQTRSVNSRYRHQLNRFEYLLEGEYGQTINFLLDEAENEQKTYRVSGNMAYRFKHPGSIRIFGSWSNINRFVSEDQRTVTAGLSVNSQLVKNLKAHFHLQNAYDIDEYYRNRNLMQLNLDYHFRKKHALSLRSYYTLFRRETGDPNLFLSATYRCKVGIPLKQLIKAGDVNGRITGDDGEPREGIILHLYNKSTITNQNGEFAFRSVQPGTHLLTIDRSRLEIDEIPGIPFPAKIEVIEDRKATLRFGITKGAKVTGELLFLKSGGTPVSSDDLNRAGIIMELKSDFNQYRIETDGKGRFSFPLIIPGSWRLKIYDQTVPQGFEPEKLLYAFDLSPAEKKDLRIRIRRKKREIIFKSGNFSLSTSGRGEKKALKMDLNPEISSGESNDEIFYSVQIGAFARRPDPQSVFFRGRKFDFERQINNLHKYFIGRFESLEKAIQKKEKLESDFPDAFVVAFKKGELIFIND